MNHAELYQKIDHGLDIACAQARYGRPMPREELATYCGCSTAHLHNIEKAAIRKLQKRLCRPKESPILS